MRKLSIQYRSDFHIAALLALWFVLAIMAGILVWVLSVHVPHLAYFNAPMIRAVSQPGPAYASLVVAIAIGLLAPFHLAKSLIIRGVTPAMRFVCILAGIGCIAFLAEVNPFTNRFYAGQIASEVLAFTGWVLIAATGTVASFFFSVFMTVGIARQG